MRLSNTSIAGFEGRSVTDADRGVLLTGLAGGACLLVAFGLFLSNSTLTVVPVLGFLGATTYGWFNHQAATVKSVTFLATLGTTVVLGLISVFLIARSIPVFQHMGIRIFGLTDPVRVFGVTVLPGVEELWSTSGDVYSLTPMIWGTLMTTVIAMLVAGPLGVAGAIFIAEIAPPLVRETVKPGIEILAGIPSIVYGWLGFVLISPFVYDHLGTPGLGNMAIVGVVIGLMALPTVVSVAEDALTSVPNSMKDGSLALGATDWQTIKGITMPASFSGVSAAVLLGVGRAVGETMAATVILSNVVKLPEPLYNVFGNTISLTSLIASQYGNADGMHMQALFAAGVVLFVSVMFLSIVSQTIEARMKRKLEGRA